MIIGEFFRWRVALICHLEEFKLSIFCVDMQFEVSNLFCKLVELDLGRLGTLFVHIHLIHHLLAEVKKLYQQFMVSIFHLFEALEHMWFDS